MGCVAALALAACGPGGRRETGPAVEETGTDAPASELAAPDVLVMDATDEPAMDALDVPDVREEPTVEVPPDAADVLDAADTIDVVSPPDVITPPDVPEDRGAPDAADARVYSSACNNVAATVMNGSEIVGRAFGPSRETAGDCVEAAPGPEEIFVFQNAMPSRWFFNTDDPRTTAQTVLSVRSACSDPASEYTCVDDGSGTSGRTNFSVYIRETRFFALMMDRQDSPEAYDYALRVRRVPIALNAVCTVGFGTVIAPDGARVMNENTESAYRSGAQSCLYRQFAPWLFYRLAVPPMTQVAVTATPTEGPSTPVSWRPVVRITSECEGPCFDYGVAPAAGMPGTGLAINPTTTARNVFVAVGGYDENVFGRYTLTTSSSAIQQGASCEVPEEVSPGLVVRGRETTQGGGPSEGCGIIDAGEQRHYRVSVPAGKKLRVTVTPNGDAWTPVIRRQRGCPIETCVGGAVGPTAGTPVTYTIENPGDAARTFAFTVAARERGAHTYDLTSELDPGTIPYIESTIPAHCDTLSDPSTLRPAATTDEGVTDPLALPFAFSLFGQSNTHYTVASNGFLQLFSSATATGSTSSTHVVLPNATAPRSILAPYWGDLSPRFPGGEVRTGLVTDAGGARFVAHWGSFQLGRDTSTLLSFQVKLYEASRAIEYHWCTLNEPEGQARARGALVTVGLQDSAGIEGLTFTHNAPGTIDPTQALRYVPRP